MKNAVCGRYSSTKASPGLCGITAALLLFALACMAGGARAAETGSAPTVADVTGKWVGVGKFLGVDIDKEVGTVPIAIEIDKDGKVTGAIADAKLTKTSIAKVRYGFEIHAILDGKLKKDKNVTKDHLIILFVTPKPDKDGALVSDANFHVKSNYVFDLTMLVGGVMLKKQP